MVMNLKNIDERRVSLGISQRDLCKRAGVHYMTYSANKNGRQMPNTRTLQKLTVALDQITSEQGDQAC